MNNTRLSLLWSTPWFPTVAVFVVALVLRIGCVLHYGPIVTNDSTYYLSVTQGILEGKGLGLPYRSPPVYPLFVAGVLLLYESHWAIIWAQAVMGAITCAVLGATCQRLFRSRLAFLLGVAVAIYIPMAAYCVLVLRETLIGLGVAVTTYCVVRMFQERNVRWCWLTGAACTFTLFNQATFLLFPFWLGLALWLHTRSLRDALRFVVPVLACLAVAIGLWAARNYRLTGHFIPLSADHLGYFFLEGIMDANSPKALTPEQIRYLGLAEDDPYNTYDGMRDYYWGIGEGSETASLERKLNDGPVLFSRALRLALHEPAKYFRFSLQRLHRLWFKDLWVEHDEPGRLNPRPLDRVRREYGLAGKAAAAVCYLFGYGACVGMVIFWRQTLALIVPAVTLLTFHMWVHAETRYALPIHPHLVIFAFLAVAHSSKRLVLKTAGHEITASFIKRPGD